ncbi:HET-domain-containing protein [Hyaloscypha variabilis F]|uniref:HET-domain-containing protein n=1 Tax=Hyaloscypha variabilis (strain UAMH 11265 / GT02V1 / F) TaxID=1149755 RepID=A0A2J6S5K0_HYAVF|nr:HET-domain-containing protein [Hyaloscypha variabilis F]
MSQFNYAESCFHSQTQIRLLTLLPPRQLSPENLDQPAISISTSLEAVNWKDKPPYVALSYTWGDPTLLKTVLVNGQTLEITVNLHEALRQLQTDQPVRLWVDAICINQKDDSEKNDQVKQMKEIYKDATAVFAWLGPAADDSDVAMGAIEQIGEAALTAGMSNLSREVMLKLWDPDPEGALDGVRKPLLDLSKSINLDFPLAAIKSFSERNYWNRTWIAQEFSVASNLILLSLMSKSAQATNPRDKIYGLLGLAPDAPELAIEVDYGRKVDQVFTDTAKALLQHNFTDVLSWCRFPKLQPDLPSWVPDFNAALPTPLASYKCRAPPWKPLFSASGSSKVNISNDNNTTNTRLLTISGLTVDTIEELGTPYKVGDNETASMNIFFHEVAECCNRAEKLQCPVSTDPQFWEEAFWRVPCADQQRHEYVHRRATLEAQDGLLEILNRIGGELSGYRDEVRAAAWQRYYLAMQCLYDFRPFFSKKGYIGLAPEFAAPGDTICVILGAIAPYVLRKVSGGGFELVGEAYVHGIMDGEAMDMGLDEEEFCLS